MRRRGPCKKLTRGIYGIAFCKQQVFALLSRSILEINIIRLIKFNGNWKEHPEEIGLFLSGLSFVITLIIRPIVIVILAFYSILSLF